MIIGKPALGAWLDEEARNTVRWQMTANGVTDER